MKRAITKCRVCSLIIVVLGLSVLISSFLPLFLVKYTPLLEKLPAQVQTWLMHISQAIGQKSGTIGFSGIDVIRLFLKKSVFTEKKSWFYPIVRLLIMGLMIPYFAAVFSVIFSLVRKKWSYVVSASFSTAGLFGAVLLLLILLPIGISREVHREVEKAEAKLESTAEGSISSLFDRLDEHLEGNTSASGTLEYVRELTEEKAEEAAGQVLDELDTLRASSVRRFILGHLMPGWWIMTICLVLITYTAALGILYSSEAMIQEPPLIGKSYVVCLFGNLRGARISINDGDSLSIGSGTDNNLVLREKGIEKRHCSISYDANSGMFHISVFASGGVWSGSEKLIKGSEKSFPRGTFLCLGNHTNKIGLGTE